MDYRCVRLERFHCTMVTPVLSFVTFQFSHFLINQNCFFWYETCTGSTLTFLLSNNMYYLEYALRELMLLSTDAVLYFALFLHSLAASVAFRFLSFSHRCTAFSPVALKTSGGVPIACCHASGPHDGPKLHRSPAPAQRACQEPLWILLICFPPSNFDLICIQLSARLVVKLPVMYAYLTIVLTTILAYQSTVVPCSQVC